MVQAFLATRKVYQIYTNGRYLTFSKPNQHKQHYNSKNKEHYNIQCIKLMKRVAGTQHKIDVQYILRNNLSTLCHALFKVNMDGGSDVFR